jgi:DNA-binding NtrC family response regulator
MAIERFETDPNRGQFQSPEGSVFFDFQQTEKISPEYLDEWKERTFRKEVFELFVEYFCFRKKVPFKELIGHVEKSILIRTLSQFNGSQKSAAKFLGIKYTTLNEKLKRYNIRIDKKPV